jgi:urate oxidase
MERLRVSAEEQRFEAVPVPTDDGGFEVSPVLFERRHDSRAMAVLEMGRRAGGAVELGGLQAGCLGLELLKTTGSAFADFPRDEYTTLPSRPDRLLFANIDVTWRYADPQVAIVPDAARYVAAEQVADLAAVVFHQFVSLSIQHLVHEIGTRMFERFPALVEIDFEAQNRTFDTAEISADDARTVYTDPRPPYGRIGLTMRRD